MRFLRWSTLKKYSYRCSCRAYVPTLGSTTVLPHQNHLTILTFVHPHGILIDRCFFHTHMYIYIYNIYIYISIAPFKTRLMESPYPHGYPPKSPAGTCSQKPPPRPLTAFAPGDSSLPDLPDLGTMGMVDGRSWPWNSKLEPLENTVILKL